MSSGGTGPDKAKKANALKSFFPDLGGIPLLGATNPNPNLHPKPLMPIPVPDPATLSTATNSASTSDSDPSGPAKLSMAQLHFQKLLAQPSRSSAKEPVQTSSKSQPVAEQAKSSDSSKAKANSAPAPAAKEKEKKSDSTEVKILTRGSVLPGVLPTPPVPPVKTSTRQAVTQFDTSKSLRYTVQDAMDGAFIPAETNQISLIQTKRLAGSHVLSGGRRITANAEYICYATRNGLRVLHRGSVEKLMVAAKDTVDTQFCPRNPALLAVASSAGFGIYELRFVVEQHALQSRPVLTVRPGEGDQQRFSRVKWHPKQERVCVAVAGETVSFIMLSSKLWQRQQSAGPQGIPVEEARVKEVVTPGEVVSAVDFDETGEKMLTANYMKVKVWKVTMLEEGVDVALLNAMVAHDGSLLSDAFFMGNSLVTCANENTTLRLWDLAQDGKTKTNAYQQLTLLSSAGTESSYVVRPAPSEGSIVLANTNNAGMLCVTLRPKAPPAFHQLIEFSLAHTNPTFSFDIVKESAQASDTLVLYCLQSEGAETRTIRIPDAPRLPQRASLPVTEQVKQVPTESKPISLPLPPMAPLPGATPTAPTRPPAPEQPTVKVPIPVPAPPAPPAPGRVPGPASTRAASNPKATKKSQGNGNGSVEAQGDASGAGSNSGEVLLVQLKSMFSRLEEQAKVRADKDTERQQLLLKVLSKSLNEIPDSVEESLQEFLGDEAFKTSLTNVIVPAMMDKVKLNVPQSIDVEALSSALQPALARAFKESVEKALIPAFSASCNNMASQFSQFLRAQGQSESASNTSIAAEVSELRASQHAMAKQLNKLEGMLSKIAASTRQSASAQQSAAGSGGGNSPGGGSASSQEHGLTPEQQMNYWIGKGDYENAFLSVLHSNDGKLLTSACKRIDGEKLFHTTPIPLSGRAMLSLFHQLSFDLMNEPRVRLQWLKMIGLVLNKDDPELKVHIPRVVGQVRAALEKARPVLADPSNPASSEYKMCCLVVNAL